MSRFSAVAVGLLVTIGLAPTVVAVDSLEIALDSGIVRGIDTGATREWRGIPYVAAPIGDLRWRRPMPVNAWPGVRDASEFGPACIQLLSGTEILGNEDCLYLNVFTPPEAIGSSGLPVMVHLHGGNNSSFWPYQNASAFVAHDVIVVTLAYRLGVFGFVGHPALSSEGSGVSGEYGIFDQIAALEWVQRNIAAFGGDPNNVTLFGESSGSFDAVALVASPRGAGLFVRAALQTEAFDAFYDPGSIADAETLGLVVADSLGCSSAVDIAGCLRARPAQELVLALGFIDAKPRIGGEILSASPRDLLAADEATVPLLVGSNREEAAFQFEEPFTGGAFGKNAYANTIQSIVAPDAGRIVRSLYPIQAYDNALWASIALWTDGLYTCPIRALANTSSGPVWRYLYTHVYENNDFLAGLRASHFLDDPIMWRDPTLLEGFGAADYAFSPAENRLSAVMTGYWTNFAKTGDPNGPGLPEWPPFTSPNPQTLVLDDAIDVLTGWRDLECDFFDSVPLFIKSGWFHGGRFPSGIPLPGPR